MSQWMNRKGSAQAYVREPLPQTFAIAMQGNSAFPQRNPCFSEGARGDVDPLVYNVTAQNASVSYTPLKIRSAA